MLRFNRLMALGALTLAPLHHAAAYDQQEQLVDDSQVVRAFKNGQTKLDFRLRHENAQQGDLKHAQATTLRSQVTFSTSDEYTTIFNIQATDVSNLFGRKYNTTVSGLTKPEYATISDPRGTGLTNVYLKYTGIEYTNVIFGRQYISVGDGIYVGNIDFRQFPQSFDAISVENQPIRDLSLRYSYIDHVNTTNATSINSEGRRKLNTHLLSLAWSGTYYNKLSAFMLFNKDKDVKTNSGLTLGIDIDSTDAFKDVMGFYYKVAWAQLQAKYGHPNPYNAYRFAASVGLEAYDGFDFNIGYERLGGKNTTVPNKAFQTPLGDYHKHLGLADVFETTPGQGVQDVYMKVFAKLPEAHADVGAEYHNFRFADSATSHRAGYEFDLYGTLHLNEHLDLDVVWAHFYSKSSSLNKTRRLWASLTARL